MLWSPELPVNIVNPLQDQTAVERGRVLLDCTVSSPRCSVRWYRGPTVILPSQRFEICSEGCYRRLIIQPVELRDQGTYSVQVGEYSCSAHLTVEGRSPPPALSAIIYLSLLSRPLLLSCSLPPSLLQSPLTSPLLPRCLLEGSGQV